MEYSLKNLEKIVQKKADDAFIKSIIRKYINIDITSPFCDVSDLLYAALRIDENSIGKINEEDKRKFADEVKRDFISRYGVPQYNPITKPQPGWFTYKSWKLLGTDRISEGEYRHRLYINSKASNLMALSNAIYDELKKRKIPFYFKIPNNENNEKGYKDSIVLYTTTPLLDDTIKAILKIEKNNPNLVRNCNAPSELVGQINDYIGYAFESENAKCSYSTLICNSFENGIENAVKNWCLNNITATIGKENIKEYYFCEYDSFEFKKKTQKLVYTIPRVDKEFPAILCNSVRNAMEKLGIDPNNICMDKKTSADIKAFCNSGQKLELTPDGVTEEKNSSKSFSQDREPNAFEIDDEDEYENKSIQKRELNAFGYDELDYLKEQRRKLEEETKQENTNIMHI